MLYFKETTAVMYKMCIFFIKIKFPQCAAPKYNSLTPAIFEIIQSS